MKPMEAALKGAGEIGFTIVSISLSLVAVFIPLLLMGGIVGRLFREFAVTVTITIARLGVGLADADADDVLALPDQPPRRSTAGSTASSRASSTACWRSTARTLDIALRLPLHHADGVPRDRGAHRRALFVIIPKGFFPEQDIGLIIGISEAAQDASFAEMAKRSSSSPTSCAAIPRSHRSHRRLARAPAASRATTAASSSP